MNAAPRGAEDPNVLRRQLLIELSVLRRRYAQLSDETVDAETEAESAVPSKASGAVSSYAAANVPAAVLEEGDDVDVDGDEEASSPLGQSDRDAIEALFHSVDDFTRDFNEGKGGLERDDIVSRIMHGAT